MNKKRIPLYILYTLVQCTWGLGQTFIGFLFFLRYINKPHHYYHGCIETRWGKKWSGLSLGLFIFTPEEGTEEVRVHEYGHTFQSLILGPFYIVPGIISIVWGCLPYYQKQRREKKLPYTTCFVEAGASRFGEKATGEKALW